MQAVKREWWGPAVQKVTLEDGRLFARAVHPRYWPKLVTRHFGLGQSLGDGRRDFDGFGNRIGTRLDHAVLPDKEFGMRIDGQPIIQGLQFRPEAGAAKSRDRMKLTPV